MFFGSNDASKDPAQHVELDRYKDNTTFIAQSLLDAGCKVILVGPAPHDEIHRDELFPGDPSLNPRSTLANLEYSKACGEVARNLGIPFIDLWHAFLYSVDWKDGEPIPGHYGSKSPLSIRHLLNDGLHFTGDGYKVWYDEIGKVIQERFPEFVPQNVPFLYPEWAVLPGPGWDRTKQAFETKKVPEN